MTSLTCAILVNPYTDLNDKFKYKGRNLAMFKLPQNLGYLFGLCLMALVSMVTSACAYKLTLPDIFISADPGVDAVLDYYPRTLRIFLKSLPDIRNSEIHFYGKQGEVSLSHFHTMGANDLMIEIDDYPLPNGKYRVEWIAAVGEENHRFRGEYQFSVAVEE
jgi:methionine-rich copper-binding protein CopC